MYTVQYCADMSCAGDWGEHEGGPQGEIPKGGNRSHGLQRKSKRGLDGVSRLSAGHQARNQVTSGSHLEHSTLKFEAAMCQDLYCVKTRLSNEMQVHEVFINYV